MSDGLKDALSFPQTLYYTPWINVKAAGAGLSTASWDNWDDDDEITQIIKDIDKDLGPGWPWLSKVPDTKCECGGEKLKTTHSNWCPKWKVYR